MIRACAACLFRLARRLQAAARRVSGTCAECGANLEIVRTCPKCGKGMSEEPIVFTTQDGRWRCAVYSQQRIECERIGA
jgi:hypothetical protein